jgi:hypothetical protein
MRKQILVAILGLGLLAGCSDTSPSKFNRGSRYVCEGTALPNSEPRYCAEDFKTPINGAFKYENKLGETLVEQYDDGYIVYAVHLNAAGVATESARRVIENGLLVQIERVVYGEDSRKIISEIHTWGFKSVTYKENAPPLVRQETLPPVA